MPIRGELPITLTPADEIRRLLGAIYNEIALLAKDLDFLVVCVAGAIGLTFSTIVMVLTPLSIMAASSSAGYGGGGSTAQFARMVNDYNVSGEEFRITGHCQSACTMFLGIRNVCVDRSAHMLFHAARTPAGTARMASSYNAELRDYLTSKGWLDTPEFHTLSGAQVIAFGYRAC